MAEKPNSKSSFEWISMGMTLVVLFASADAQGDFFFPIDVFDWKCYFYLWNNTLAFASDKFGDFTRFSIDRIVRGPFQKNVLCLPPGIRTIGTKLLLLFQRCGLMARCSFCLQGKPRKNNKNPSQTMQDPLNCLWKYYIQLKQSWDPRFCLCDFH